MSREKLGIRGFRMNNRLATSVVFVLSLLSRVNTSLAFEHRALRGEDVETGPNAVPSDHECFKKLFHTNNGYRNMSKRAVYQEMDNLLEKLEKSEDYSVQEDVYKELSGFITSHFARLLENEKYDVVRILLDTYANTARANTKTQALIALSLIYETQADLSPLLHSKVIEVVEMAIEGLASRHSGIKDASVHILLKLSRTNLITRRILDEMKDPDKRNALLSAYQPTDNEILKSDRLLLLEYIFDSHESILSSEGFGILFLDEGGIDLGGVLLEGVGNLSPGDNGNAVRVIRNMFRSGMDDCVENLLEYEGAQDIVRDVLNICLNTRDEGIREDSLWVIGNLYNHELGRKMILDIEDVNIADVVLQAADNSDRAKVKGDSRWIMGMLSESAAGREKIEHSEREGQGSFATRALIIGGVGLSVGVGAVALWQNKCSQSSKEDRYIS